MTSPLSEYRTKADWLAATIADHNSDECLLWPFAVDRDGYGRVCFYGDGKKQRVFAHRVAFRLIHGRWPEPLGLHSCDNPPCFNPRHITEGGHAKNQREKVLRGRSLRGVQQHDAKLTDEIVRQARGEYICGKVGFHRLAKKYGVSDHGMKLAITGKSWRHV